MERSLSGASWPSSSPTSRIPGSAMRCAKRCPNPSPPLGWTKEQIAASAAHGHCATQGAQCEHDDGHDGPHRNGGLAWHDPPVLYVGGVRA